MITRHIIDGQEVSPAIVNNNDAEQEASFTNDEVQANVSGDSYEFILDAYTLLKEQIDTGNIFRKIPYQRQVFDGVLQTTFNGFIALYEQNSEKPFSADIPNSPSISTVIRQDGVASLFDDLNAIDWDFLVDKGHLTDSDFMDSEYVVENYYSPLELILILSQITAFTIALIENTYKIANAAATFAGTLAGGISGPIGAVLFAALNLIALIAYQFVLGLTLYSLAKNLADTYLLPKRITKSCSLGTLFRKMISYFGYTLSTNIDELDRVAITPANTQSDELTIEGFIRTPQGSDVGYPKMGQAGYVCLDYLNILKDHFNAKVAVVDNVVYFYRTLDDFWKINSTYVMESIQPQEFERNTNDLVGSYIFRYSYDYTDEFTLEDNAGVNVNAQFEIDGDNTQFPKRIDKAIPWSLCARKEELNAAESAVESFFTTANRVLAIFNTSIGARYLNKIGSIKVSTNNWSYPKIFPFEGSKMSPNPKSILSAPTIYNKYHFDVSPKYRQRIRYNVEISRFTLVDYNQLINNSLFTTYDGKQGKAERILWKENQDKAEFEYYIEEDYLNTEVQERIIERV